MPPKPKHETERRNWRRILHHQLVPALKRWAGHDSSLADEAWARLCACTNPRVLNALVLLTDDKATHWNNARADIRRFRQSVCTVVSLGLRGVENISAKARRILQLTSEESNKPGMFIDLNHDDRTLPPSTGSPPPTQLKQTTQKKHKPRSAQGAQNAVRQLTEFKTRTQAARAKKRLEARQRKHQRAAPERRDEKRNRKIKVSDLLADKVLELIGLSASVHDRNDARRLAKTWSKKQAAQNEVKPLQQLLDEIPTGSLPVFVCCDVFEQEPRRLVELVAKLQNLTELQVTDAVEKLTGTLVPAPESHYPSPAHILSVSASHARGAAINLHLQMKSSPGFSGLIYKFVCPNGTSSMLSVSLSRRDDLIDEDKNDDLEDEEDDQEDDDSDGDAEDGIDKKKMRKTIQKGKYVISNPSVSTITVPIRNSVLRQYFTAQSSAATNRAIRAHEVLEYLARGAASDDAASDEALQLEQALRVTEHWEIDGLVHAALKMHLLSNAKGIHVPANATRQLAARRLRDSLPLEMQQSVPIPMPPLPVQSVRDGPQLLMEHLERRQWHTHYSSAAVDNMIDQTLVATKNLQGLPAGSIKAATLQGPAVLAETV